MSDYRLHQRLCRVAWEQGQPCIEVGRVTKVTARSWHVNGKSARHEGWKRTWQEAIRQEYTSIFHDACPMCAIFKRNPAGLSEKAAVLCICRLRRLGKRLRRRKQNTAQPKGTP